MKKKLILWLALLLAAFLGGYIPQFLQVQRARGELAAARQQLSSCQAGTAVSQLKDTAAMLYLQATLKNYGTASEYAARFFQSAQQTASQTNDPALASALGSILQSRDKVTAALANGDPSVMPDLQQLLQKLEQVGK